MRIANFRDIQAQAVDEPGASGVTVRWLISEKEGAPNFAMRLFGIEPGGSTPYHTHEWEHEVFILEGTGSLVTEEGDFPLYKGDALFVPGEEKHQFKNASQETLMFICVVPNQK